MTKIVKSIEAVQITKGPKHHFFGYYDKHQWDKTDRYILSNEVDFVDRSPDSNDQITLGMIDTQRNYEFIPLSTSKAWCWQQGTMFQWIPGCENKVIHNDRIGDRFVSVIIDVENGNRKVLPRPIYTLSNDGKKALSLNFSRVAVTRPGYGYNGLEDWRIEQKHPSDDGIYIMDVDSGDHKLIISLDEIVRIKHQENMDDSIHWFNHLLFNPTNDRFIFLHRWSTEDKKSFYTRLCTADVNGENIFVSDILDGSHFIWYDNSHILIWARGYKGNAYYIVEDMTDDTKIIGENILNRNGHCTISPNGRWILTDEYPDAKGMRPLILFDIENKIRYDIGCFYSPPEFQGELRCDLHPRWNRTGNMVCIDSVHSGERQMYVLDVGDVVK